MCKHDLRSMNQEELVSVAESIGEKAYRGKQIFKWINQKHVNELGEMTSLPILLRQKLAEEWELSELSVYDRIRSEADETTKYLFHIGKNNIIEGVLMKYSYGNSACISTQCGCKMGCVFCASGMDGFERDLTAGEMCGQIYAMQKDGGKISTVVLMGCGEPLDNYDNVLRFLEIINHPDGMNIGQRHITVSTCGIIPSIYRLAEAGLQVTLAVSLHAPNDGIRAELMPTAKAYPMDDLLTACRYYAERTKRRITYEYALVPGVNDSMGNAGELGRRLKGDLCHVNLIPVNGNAARDIHNERKKAEAFSKILCGLGVETTVRRTLGQDVNAACGQLRRRVMPHNKENSR